LDRLGIFLYLYLKLFFMHTLSPAVIAYALQRNHPDIYQKLTDDISSTLPQGRVSDVGMLRGIVQDFCNLLSFHKINWKDSRHKELCIISEGSVKEYRVTELREILLGVVLLYYHPERIHQVMPGQIKSGLIKELSKQLNVDKATLSLGANNAITYFKAYKAFNENVLYVYNELNKIHKYLEVHGNT
jgi:hypothetical protein